jgi:hypothetical protein
MRQHDTRRHRRGSSAWSEQFSSPQSVRRSSEDEVETAAAHRTSVVALPHNHNVLEPPCFNMYPLEKFLRSTGVCARATPSESSRSSKSCLLEDRTLRLPSPHIRTNDDTAESSIDDVAQGQEAEWLPDTVARQALNESELSHHLLQKVSRLCFPPVFVSDELSAAQA